MISNKQGEKILVTNSAVHVPPFECAWLKEDIAPFKNGSLCITFDVKGETDATIILRTIPDSRRWQYSTTKNDKGEVNSESYTIIIGSNRNKLLTLEREGVFRVHSKESWTTISQNKFKKFWIFYEHGNIYVGAGDLDINNSYNYSDPHPINGIKHVGISSWDKHLIYRNIIFEDPGIASQKLSINNYGMMSLVQLSIKAIINNVTVETATRISCILTMLDFPNSEGILKETIKYLSDNFEIMSEEYKESFYSLPATIISKIIQSSSLTSTEMQIFKAVCDWTVQGESQQAINIKSDEELYLVFSNVRFALMEKDELHEVLSNPIIFKNSRLIDCVNESKAMKHADFKNNNAMSIPVMDSRRMVCNVALLEKYSPRLIKKSHHLQYSYSGDFNGIFYYLGTNYGKSSYVNPMMRKKVIVTGTSPTNRFTVPKGIVGYAFKTTNYVSSKIDTFGNKITSWTVELIDHLLICNYYTIRQDASCNFMRSWNLEGSNDGKTWSVLSGHKDDETITMPGAYGAWPISCNAKAYRIFRIILTGPTTDYSSLSDKISLSNFELYGILILPDMS